MYRGVKFLSDCIDFMLDIKRYLKDFIEYSGPFFLECQTYLINFLRSLRYYNKLWNPLLFVERELPSPPPVIHRFEPDPFFGYVSVIISLISFVAVAIFWISYCSKKYNETPASLDPQVEELKMLKKENDERLTEIYKILFELKYQIASVPENRINRPISNPVPRPRTLYSSVFKHRKNEDFSNSENTLSLNGSFQKALQLLQEQIEGRSSLTDTVDLVEDEEHLVTSFDDKETPTTLQSDANETNAKYQKTNSRTECLEAASWMRSSERNGFSFLENKVDGKRIVADEQKRAEKCEMCLRLKEALWYIQQQTDCKSITEHFPAESTGVLLCRKCSEEGKIENSTLGGNVRNLRSSSVQKNLEWDGESSEMSEKTRKTNESSNGSSSQRALSVEILFNRDIKLCKAAVK